MINSLSQFIQYFESLRRRTHNYLKLIPPDRLTWSPKEGEFTIGELVNHISASERMFVGVALDGRWLYPGHALDQEAKLEGLLSRLDLIHAECIVRLSALPDSELLTPRSSLQGPEIKVWRWLMAMAEHEVHHRSQLAMYLTLLGIEPPHIFGLGVEDLIARATG